MEVSNLARNTSMFHEASRSLKKRPFLIVTTVVMLTSLVSWLPEFRGSFRKTVKKLYRKLVNK
jgi:hypothetical protein